MDLSSMILQISFLTIFSKMLAFGFAGKEVKKCRYMRDRNKMTIRCSDMFLKEVPQYLKASVEVLDLTLNRIKKLKRTSFERYTSLTSLLLYENKVQFVEPGTFDHLTSLEEIDLASNSLLTIPLEIFQLPSLRNLYVDSNELLNLESDLEALETPIAAPLEYLNVADCGLEDIPDLGVLPKLRHINVSSNPLTDLSIDRFANMCQLTALDLTKSDMSACACQQINAHFQVLGVKSQFIPVCATTLDIKVCPQPYNYTVRSKTFELCKNTKTLSEKRSAWIFTAGCIGGILLVLILVWYYINRRRRRRAKKKKMAQNKLRNQFVVSPKNAINNNREHLPVQKFPLGKQEDVLLNCDNA